MKDETFRAVNDLSEVMASVLLKEEEFMDKFNSAKRRATDESDDLLSGIIGLGIGLALGGGDSS